MSWFNRLLRKLGLARSKRKGSIRKTHGQAKGITIETSSESISVRIPKKKLAHSLRSTKSPAFLESAETSADKILDKARMISGAGSNLAKKVIEQKEPPDDAFSPVGK
jgi:hypothetical protein